MKTFIRFNPGKMLRRVGAAILFSAALADERISIQGMTLSTEKHDNVAHMRMAIAISGLPQLSKVLARIAQLPNIISARRRK